MSAPVSSHRAYLPITATTFDKHQAGEELERVMRRKRGRKEQSGEGEGDRNERMEEGGGKRGVGVKGELRFTCEEMSWAELMLSGSSSKITQN
eukprot:749068-Hanusia_phi.AAC.4